MTVVALIVVPGCPDPPGGLAAALEVDAFRSDLLGRPLVWHTVRRVLDAGVTRVGLVVDPADETHVRTLDLDPAVTVVVAADRGVGMRAALAALLDGGPALVLVHDPARALAPVPMIRRVLDRLRDGAVAVLPILPVVDTIRSVDADGRASAVVDRGRLRIVQSPQGFTADVLRRALDTADGSTTDDAARVLAAGFPLTTVTGHADAARLVTVADLDHARRTLASASTDLQEHSHA